MFERTLKAARLVAILLRLAVIAPSLAYGQAPPMDMSWAIRSQQQAWNVGQLAQGSESDRQDSENHSENTCGSKDVATVRA